MTDPTAFNPQSTNRLPVNTSPDSYNVLLRGRIRVAASDYTLSSGWYRATKEVDLSQFDIDTLQRVSFSTNEDGTIPGPYTITGNTGTVTSAVRASVSNGDKAGGTSTKITFRVGNNHGTQMDIFWEVLSSPAAGSMFTDNPATNDDGS